MNMFIGKRLKELREAKKMSLTELSKRSGIQIATLSRIENRKMIGTLDSHMSIAKALGVNLPELYADIAPGEKKIDVQTSQSQKDIFLHSDKSSYEILTSKVLSKKMMPTLIKIEPQGKTDTEQNQPGTEKFIFVLEGEIEAKIGSDTYVLARHHSLYFDASLPHYFANSADSVARVISVVTPVAL